MSAYNPVSEHQLNGDAHPSSSSSSASGPDSSVIPGMFCLEKSISKSSTWNSLFVCVSPPPLLKSSQGARRTSASLSNECSHRPVHHNIVLSFDPL